MNTENAEETLSNPDLEYWLEPANGAPPPAGTCRLEFVDGHPVPDDGARSRP